MDPDGDPRRHLGYPSLRHPATLSTCQPRFWFSYSRMTHSRGNQTPQPPRRRPRADRHRPIRHPIPLSARPPWDTWTLTPSSSSSSSSRAEARASLPLPLPLRACCKSFKSILSALTGNGTRVYWIGAAMRLRQQSRLPISAVAVTPILTLLCFRPRHYR